MTNPRSLFHAVRLERVAADVVEAHGIDIIHSHFGWPRGLGGLLARAETGRPLVATFRGMDILLDHEIDYGLRRDQGYDASVRRLLRLADRTTYATGFMRRQGVALGAVPSRTRVIRKGVDIERFVPSSSREANARELGLSGPVVLSVAGLIPRKGTIHVLEALSLLKDSSEFTYVHCGEGPELADLEGRARRLGLADRVRFVGRVPRREIPRYFAACEVFVLASLLEAAGNVILEAMAAGCAVICTDSGGPTEYLRDGATGIVVPPADPQALAEKIRLLLQQPALRASLGREGRRVAEEECAYSRMTERYLRTYQELLGRSRPRDFALAKSHA